MSTAQSSVAQTAAQKVLSTPELLESVLSYLSFHDLLVHAQRVNRTFYGVISTSPSIQIALFFLPSPDQLISQPCPLLRASTNTRFVDKRVQDWDQVQRDLRKQGSELHRGEWVDDADLKPYSRVAASASRKEAAEREDASWRRMLLVQPPIKEVHLDSGKGWISSDDWLRMEDLDKNIVTLRHIAVNEDGIGNLRVHRFFRGKSSRH